MEDNHLELFGTCRHGYSITQKCMMCNPEIPPKGAELPSPIPTERKRPPRSIFEIILDEDGFVKEGYEVIGGPVKTLDGWEYTIRIKD